MKAVLFEKFGGPEVLKIGDLPRPNPQANEVLIRVRYTSVNPVDWKIREGYLRDFFPHRFPIIPGWDAAGEVAAVGDRVSEFGVGEKVYAYTRLPEVHSGTYAEYIALPASAVAPIPKTLTLRDAAAIPLAGLTAYQALHDRAKIKSGQRVLILGGAGGVGGFAAQFAQAAGAEVSATASAGNLSYLASLGVTHPVNYANADAAIEQLQKIAPDGFDIVLDAVGGQWLSLAQGLVRRGGHLVSIVEEPKLSPDYEGKYNAVFHFVEPSGHQLQKIATLIDGGHVVVPAVSVRSIREATAAQVENAKRHVRGKVVLELNF
jgi:NADPH:quinone reductase-like Zn-dependent oxidoreductase